MYALWKENIALHGTTKLSAVQWSSLYFNHLIHCGPRPTPPIKRLGGRGIWAPNKLHSSVSWPIYTWSPKKGGKKKLSRTDSTYLPPDFPNSIRLGTRERIETHQDKEDGRSQRRRKSDDNNTNKTSILISRKMQSQRIPTETAPQGKERISATARFVIRKPSDGRKRGKNKGEILKLKKPFEYFLRNPIYR